MIKLTNESLNFIDNFIGKTNVKDSIYYKKLYTYLNQYYNRDLPKYTIIEKPVKLNLQENRFRSQTITNNIYRLKQYHLISTIINNCKVIIHIYHNDDLTNFVRIILTCIQFMYDLSGSKKNLTITYYLTNCKKIIRNKILTINEVNTGSSSIMDITIWRKEEVYKTTIHELIHFMNLDYKGDTPDIIKHYQNRYNCPSDLMNTFEAYTDFWAILINIYLTTKLLNNPYKFFINCINLEKTFIEYQSHKILRLNRDYNRHTSVLAYYVIKAELFQNLPKTLKAMDVKIGINDKYFDYLLSLKKIEPKKKYDNRTLRMSIIEVY